MLRFPWAGGLLALALIGQPTFLTAQDAAETIPQIMGRVADLLENGRTDDARLLLEELVETRPRYGPARLELGRLALERGSAEVALEHLEVAVQVPLRRAFLAWHLFGRAQLLAGRGTAATRAFDEALARAERFAPALAGRACAAFLLGRLEVAEADARRAVALEAAQGLADVLLATILAEEGRDEEAGAALSERKDPWRVLEGFQRLLEWLPAEPRVEERAARFALGVGAFDEAECFAERGLRAIGALGWSAAGAPSGASEAIEESGDEVSSSRVAARLHEVLARAQIADARFEAASASVRMAIELGDERGQTLALLGQAAIGDMRIEAAVEAYLRALKLDVNVVDEISTTGLAALAEELDRESRLSLEEHLEAHSECRAGLYSLGLVARRDGDLEAAVGYFERLAELEEDSSTRYALAGLFQRLGDDERSRIQMNLFDQQKREEEAEWLRQNDAFRRRLGAQAIAAAQPLESLQTYRVLAEDNLATADDYLAAGQTLSKLGLHEDAREWFERVLDREPFQRNALEGLAKTFEAAPASAESRQVQERLDLLSWACKFPEL